MIKTIPWGELVDFRDAAVRVIAQCEYSIHMGVDSYATGPVQDKLDRMRRNLAAIDAELTRRTSAGSAFNFWA